MAGLDDRSYYPYLRIVASCSTEVCLAKYAGSKEVQRRRALSIRFPPSSYAWEDPWGLRFQREGTQLVARSRPRPRIDEAIHPRHYPSLLGKRQEVTLGSIRLAGKSERSADCDPPGRVKN
jgi:hypothetical protein